jgi:hypothetical protein
MAISPANHDPVMNHSYARYGKICVVVFILQGRMLLLIYLPGNAYKKNRKVLKERIIVADKIPLRGVLKCH